MTPLQASQLPDATLQGVAAALRRASQQAREIARQTGTAVVIVRNGIIVEERCDQPDHPTKTDRHS